MLWVGLRSLLIPSASVVIYLNRAMPLEGGVYQWAKLGFNDLIGFMVAWNLWLFAILNTSEIGFKSRSISSTSPGHKANRLIANPWFVARQSTLSSSAHLVVDHRHRTGRRQVGAQSRRRFDAADICRP